jgi:sulfite reductase (NADPH) hemoprotein beta-component
LNGFIILWDKVMPFILSANRLRDGAVVYFAQDNSWSERIEDAAAVPEDRVGKLEEAGLDAEARNHVVGSYAIEVAASCPPYSTRLRERIRSHGPTVGDRQTRTAVEDHQSRPMGGPEG